MKTLDERFDKRKAESYTEIQNEKRNGNEKKSTFSETAKRTSAGEKKCVEESGRWSWSLALTAESA